nr:hypothetical protein CFP56_07720 [Quercus suber]
MIACFRPRYKLSYTVKFNAFRPNRARNRSLKALNEGHVREAKLGQRFPPIRYNQLCRMDQLVVSAAFGASAGDILCTVEIGAQPSDECSGEQPGTWERACSSH